MALQITGHTRAFKFKKDGDTVSLADPNPDFTPQEVIQFYSGQHPELTTCTISGPKVSDGESVYEFKTTVGTKG